MKIRGDLKEVDHLIERLISIGSEFARKDSNWSHLKNNEDFEKVYGISDFSKRAKIERIYCDGRDMAGFMADALRTINSDFTEYPTLNSIIERFQNTWSRDDLEPIIQEAKNAASELQFDNWAFEQMLSTLEEQLKLLDATSKTLEMLKTSDLYKLENGETMTKENNSIKFGDVTNSNINFNSSNVSQSVTANYEVFSKIIEAIESSEITNKDELISATRTMEEESKTGPIASSYKNFMSLAADHLTVFTPFLATLSTFL